MKKGTRAFFAVAIAVLAIVSLFTFAACSNGGKANDIEGGKVNESEHIYTHGLKYAVGEQEGTCVVMNMGIAMDGADIIIPKVYEGKTVVGIKDKAFLECNIRSVVIPDSVTSIGEHAFYNCSGLTSVTIGNSVTSIGDWAFYGCSSLTSITIPNSVTSIGGSAFSGCYKLIEVKNLSSLPIAAGSEEYGYIGYCAKRVYKEGESYLSTDKDGYIIYDDGTRKILVGYVGTKTELTLPEGITEINRYAFSSCNSLTSITIGSNVTSIGDRAFNECSSLTSITIGSNVTSIGDRAFEDCISLTSITIPNSVTSIGSYSFSGCHKLIEVKNLSSLSIVAGSGAYGFVGYYAKRVYKEGESYLSTDKDGYIIYDDGTNKILVGYVGMQTELTLPEGITEINQYAFYNCRSLTSITLPNSVTSIGNWAFYGCSSLTSITIPNSVTSIGNWVFYECSSLTQVNYKGTAEQWNKIQIGSYNSCLTSAKRNYI